MLNHAQVLGGAIWEDDSSSLVGTTVEENSANQGGGIYVSWVLQATDSAFLDNAATGPESTGGAIMISGTHGGSRVHHIDLQYVTISGNTADIGPGIADQAGKAQAAGGTIGDSVIAANRHPRRTRAGLQHRRRCPRRSCVELRRGKRGGRHHVRSRPGDRSRG